MRLLTAALLVAALAAGFWYSTSAVRAEGDIVRAGEIEAATAAVDAWGSFAATGDIRLVEDWFAVDGPQYAQLQSEADSILAGGVYEFALTDALLVEAGLVRGTVTVTSGDGGVQVFRWDIELIQEAKQWKVWTVRTSPEEPRT